MQTGVQTTNGLPAFLSLLSRQGGVGTIAQAQRLGVSKSQMRTFVRDGFFKRVAYGIVEVAGSPPSEEKRLWTGLMLASARSPDSSPAAALCGPTAAYLHDLSEEASPEIHVISTRRIDNGHDGYVFHRASRLPESEVVLTRGLPVTDPGRTFIDLAAIHPWRSISFLRRGLRKKLFSHEELLERVEMEARQGRAGITAARDALMKTHPDAAKAKSWLEDHFFDLLVNFGYPPPERNVKVRGSYGFDWEIDLYYRHLRKGIEISPSYTHSDVIILNRDRRKENDLRSLGIDIVTVTEETTDSEFRSVLAALLGPPPRPATIF